MDSQIHSETSTAEQEQTLTDSSRFALDKEGSSSLHSVHVGDVEPQLFLH